LAAANHRLTELNGALGEKERELTSQVGDLRREIDRLVQTGEALQRENQGLQEQLHSLRQQLQKGQIAPPVAQASPERIIAEAEDGSAKPGAPCKVRVPVGIGTGAINLGLDFGTHSTKVILRTRNDSKALVLSLDEPAPGYPDFAAPSLVRLDR